jgi:hypothetical protein
MLRRAWAVSLFFPAIGAVLCVAFGCDERPLDIHPGTVTEEWQPFAVVSPDFGDLSGVSPSSIYGSAGGDLLHFDGASWSRIDGPGDPIVDVWAAAGDAVFVLTPERVFRFDGTEWEELYGFDEENWGGTVFCVSTSDVLVGRANEIIRFDGSVWTADTVDSSARVEDVWASGPSDVFAVGYDWPQGTDSYRGVVFHNDGTGWSRIYEHDRIPFFYVWGTSAHDVYAASWSNVLHYDEGGWTELELPSGTGSIRGIGGTGPDDVFLLSFYHDSACALHFDGVAWQRMEGITTSHLNSIWGSSPGDVHSVGENSKIVHYNGGKWSSVSGGEPVDPRVLWGFNSRSFYVGDGSSLFHCNGAGYEELPQVGGFLGTTALWGASETSLVSVGTEGKIHRFDGAQWRRESVPTMAHLRAVSGVAEDAVWAVGDGMTCIFYDGHEWKLLLERDGAGFVDVWAASRTRVFLVASNGALVQLEGSVWTFYDWHPQIVLRAVWGSSPDDVFAVGSGGVIMHYDGARWARMPAPPDASRFEWVDRDFVAVTGAGAEDVFSVDDSGTVCHYDGVVWSRVATGSFYGLSDLWASPSGDLFCVGLSFDRNVYTLRR